MPLSTLDRQLIARFRDKLKARYAGDARFSSVSVDDRRDESSFATRFAAAPHVWVDVVLRPHIPQLRAGIVSDDRWLNADFEDAIEASGDTMGEFVELGFEEAGLTWRSPIVEHYREISEDSASGSGQPATFFYFATAFELANLNALSDAAVFDKVCRMLEGYYEAFRPTIEKIVAAAAAE
ncbi:hypothetical protein RAS1_31920 [Phycisphaerae bacterium RAS1]|nr:hypothetical protein RAS1_31920 [Phycisphaerae bacterium RAS1]